MIGWWAWLTITSSTRDINKPEKFNILYSRSQSCYLLIRARWYAASEGLVYLFTAQPNKRMFILRKLSVKNNCNFLWVRHNKSHLVFWQESTEAVTEFNSDMALGAKKRNTDSGEGPLNSVWFHWPFPPLYMSSILNTAIAYWITGINLQNHNPYGRPNETCWMPQKSWKLTHFEHSCYF